MDAVTFAEAYIAEHLPARVTLTDLKPELPAVASQLAAKRTDHGFTEYSHLIAWSMGEGRTQRGQTRFQQAPLQKRVGACRDKVNPSEVYVGSFELVLRMRSTRAGVWYRLGLSIHSRASAELQAHTHMGQWVWRGFASRPALLGNARGVFPAFAKEGLL